MKKAIFFDLDATLLTMSQKEFEHEYFSTLTKKIIDNGFDGEKFQTTLWKCVKAMWTNPGNSTNEELFWEVLLHLFTNWIVSVKISIILICPFVFFPFLCLSLT